MTGAPSLLMMVIISEPLLLVTLYAPCREHRIVGLPLDSQSKETMCTERERVRKANVDDLLCVRRHTLLKFRCCTNASVKYKYNYDDEMGIKKILFTPVARSS